MKKLGMKTGAAAQDWERTEDGIVVRVKQGDEGSKFPRTKCWSLSDVCQLEQLAPLG